MHRKNKLLVIAALFVAIFTASFPIAASAVVAPQLASKIEMAEADELVRVIIRMKDQPFVTPMMGADIVQFTLKETAAISQKPVTDFLQAQQTDGNVSVFNSFWIVNVAVAEIRADKVHELAQLPGVESIYEDFVVTIPPAEIQSEAHILNDDLMWDHIKAVFAEEVWEMGFEGQDVTVVVADTGVEVNHPELIEAFGGEAPYYEGYWAEFDENGYIVPDSMPWDEDGHGTHVSGTIGGRNINYTFGVAPKVTLAHAQVLPDGTGTFPQILGGFQWAIDRGFDIINGSLGVSGIRPELAEATDNLMAAGVVPVFANGNLGLFQFPPDAPGNTPAALAVGAYDRDGTEALFNRGDIVEYPGYEYDDFTRIKPDISAPGVDILSTYTEGRYAWGGGTSMACPHVAGVVALMLSANPDLTIMEIKEILYSTTGGHEEIFGWDDIPTKDIHYGWGRVNAYRAVSEAWGRGLSVLLEGTVKNKDGSPISGAKLEFHGPRVFTATTDKEGFFTVVVEEGFYEILVSADGYLSQTHSTTYMKSYGTVEENFVLDFAPLGFLTGKVKEVPTGTALAEVTVSVVDTNISVKTDESGQYQLELPQGVKEIEFSKPGYSAVLVENVNIIPEQTSQVDMELEFGHKTLVGRIVEHDGTPIDEAKVLLQETGETIVTDVDGLFAFDLQGGKYNLTVSRTGFLPSSTEVTVEHGTVTSVDVELELNAGTLQGTIYSVAPEIKAGGAQENKIPVAGATLFIPLLEMEATSAEDGTYKFDRVPTGQWRIMVEHEDHFYQELTAIVKKGGTTELDIALERIQEDVAFIATFDTLEEQESWEIIDNTSTGLGGWHFSERFARSKPFSASHAFPDATDDDQTQYPSNQDTDMLSAPFVVPEGDVQLSFWFCGRVRPDYHNLSVSLVNVETGKEVRLFHYAPKGWVRIGWTQVVEDISAYAGQEVRIKVSFKAIVYPSTGYSEGMFVDDIRVDYDRPLQGGIVSGLVTDADGKPIEGAFVTAMGYSERDPEEGEITRMSQTQTDADGRYEFKIPAGSWTLQATRMPAYVPGREDIYVQPGGTLDVDFTLKDNVKPDKVSGLTGQPGNNIAILSWDARVAEGTTTYNIYRSLDGKEFNRLDSTTDTTYTAEGLQNGYTYYFRVTAVDRYGLEGDPAQVSVMPVANTPSVQAFDVKPRSLKRGSPLLVSAELGHPLDSEALLDVRIEALVGENLIGEWTYPDTETGSFETAIDTVDAYGNLWAPNIYQIAMHVSDEEGRTTITNPINVAVLASLPKSLSFILGDNPFNPAQGSQSIEYALPEAGQVNISVYTIDGKRICTLVDEVKDAGQYLTFWDGTDDNGQVVFSGMYVVKIEITDAEGQRMNLMRHSVVVK